MGKTFVSDKELKTLPECCANCGWAKLPRDKQGRVLKGKCGKCAWPVPPTPFMLDKATVQTKVSRHGIWWNTGVDCPAWRAIRVAVCHGCTNPVDKEQVDDWGGWCDVCIETGRNFDRGQRPPRRD